MIARHRAQAGFTTIGKTGVGEDNQLQILEHQYGGSWHEEDGDFYDGSISAMRVDDFLNNPGVLNVATGQIGYSTDQIWSGGKFVVTAVAKFSDNTQNLSILDSGGNTHEVMNVQGSGYNITPASVVMNMNGGTFKWVRSGNSGTQTSLDSDNADGRDHLITYEIKGLPGVSTPVWMLFFEDLTLTPGLPKGRSSADFNDLVVEVRPEVNAIPLPPAEWAGLLTLSGMLFLRGRKFICASAA